MKTLLISILLSFPLLGIAENRALLIGIDTYQNVNSLPHGSSVTDVNNMLHFSENNLGFKPAQIKTLTNQHATKENIIKAFNHWLIDATQSGDKVLFYYSGHGYQIFDESGDEPDQQDETLVSYDAWIDGKNMVTDDELKELFQKLDNRQVLAVVDSCHSGSITRGLQPKGAGAFIKSPQPKTDLTRSLSDVTRSVAFQRGRTEDGLLSAQAQQIVWTAVSPAQKAFVDTYSTQYQGVFTSRFIAGIADKKADSNQDGQVSNFELLGYLRKESTAFCKKEAECKALGLGLTPTLSSSGKIGGLNVGFSPLSNTAGEADNLLPENQSQGLLVNINGQKSGKVHVAYGSVMKVKVSSQRAGYLLLLDINAKKEVTQLFPNRFHPDNQIKADQAVYIPDMVQRDGFKLSANERGDSQLIAIVTHDRVLLSDLTQIQKDLTPVARPNRHLSEVANQLQQVWTASETNRAVDYSLTRLHYVVEP